MTPSTSASEHTSTRETSLIPEPVRAGAFWSAVLLPFFSVGLLVGGLGTTTEYLLFVGLVTTNVVAVVVGHGHGR